MRAAPGAVEQRAARQPQFGPEIVQMPLQRVVERNALADQALAVIDEQPQIELGPVQCAAGSASRPSRSAARATATASMLSDFPRSRARRRDVGHQLGRDAQDALAASDQKPLKGARDMPAVLQRPDPLAAKPARPDQQRREPASADLDGLLAHQLAGRRSDRGDRVRALVSVRTEHDH